MKGEYRAIVELLQKVSGFEFDEMFSRAVEMRDAQMKITFPAGELKDIIESKKIAGRENDLLFLSKYKTLFK